MFLPSLFGYKSDEKQWSREMERVLVLGAGGYVGGRLVEALARSEWAVPVAAIRKQAYSKTFPPNVEEKIYEATDPAALQAILPGTVYIVNCVAGDSASMNAGVGHLFDLAAPDRIKRIVHMSSMAVYGEATGTVDEGSPLALDGNDYTRAKVTAENLAKKYAEKGGQVVILRPSCIYGPGSAQWTQRIGALLRAGRIGDLGPAGDGCCNLIYIDDMIDAIIKALRRPDIDGQAFNISNPETETWNQYFIDFGRALGATPIRRISERRLRIEYSLAAPVFKGLDLVSRRLGVNPARLPEPITPSLVRLWRQDIRLDHRKSGEMLGFSLTPVAKGIAESARWLNS